MRNVSNDPINDIEKISYSGQEQRLKMYRKGYENFLAELPQMSDGCIWLDKKFEQANVLMGNLAHELKHAQWMREDNPGYKGFSRTILALEVPEEMEYEYIAGPELVVGKWGNQMETPIHGHSTGYMYEHLIFGKMVINTYRMVKPDSEYVRLIESRIIEGSKIIGAFYNPDGRHFFKRQSMIHNIRSIGFSASLHYFGEHTRDGRDNGFIPEYFEDYFSITPRDVENVDYYDAMDMKMGDVMLVRSIRSDLKDHYRVVINNPKQDMVMKTVALEAPNAYHLLNRYDEVDGVIALKLNEQAKRHFYSFHMMDMVNNKVVFSKPTALVI